MHPNNHVRQFSDISCSSHEVVLWDSLIGKSPPTVNYEEVMASETGVGKWTRMIVNLQAIPSSHDLLLISLSTTMASVS